MRDRVWPQVWIRRGLMALSGLPLVVSGCSSAGGGEDDSASYRTPVLEAVRVVDASVRLPFDDYELPAADRTRMQEGEARLLERCMEERGFTVQVGGDFIRPAKLTGAYRFSDTTMWGGPFGTMPLEHARRYGYKPEPGGAFVKGPGFYHSNPAFVFLSWGPEGPDPAAEQAFQGEVDGDAGQEGDSASCLAEVEAAIGALVDLTDLAADLSKLALEHPKVEAATRAWSECMKERGFAYGAVWEASQEFSLAAVTKRQVTVAVADVECTAESGWANYYYAAVADYQRQAVDHEQDLLQSALAAEEERLEAVERELANDG